MSFLPNEVRPGERIKARDWNRLLKALRVLLNVRPGKGLSWRMNQGGISLELVAQPEIILPGIIEAVHAPGGDPSGPQDLAQVTYDVRIRERPELNWLEGITPRYRALDISVDGQPARVGDDCFVFLRILAGGAREARVWAFTEKEIYAECETPPAAAMSAPVASLMAEVARLRGELAGVQEALGIRQQASGQTGAEA